MQVFLSLTVLIAAAYARPDVGTGYNYNAGGLGGNPFGPGGYAGGGLGGDPSGSGGYGQEAPLINKRFYLHSAPEDRESGGAKHFTLGRPQKNYRVVFIKAPSAARARISAEYAPQEEKTAIYVLSQKENELDINDIATPAPTQPSKPEVFFVKYKTPQEAEFAQKQIQAQYDALGGSSQFTDEGIAPLSSVIGTFGSQPAASTNQGRLNQNYLPPNRNQNNYLPPRRH